MTETGIEPRTTWFVNEHSTVWVNENEKMKNEKNRPHRCDINRSRSSHGHKYGKCKNRLTMMMLRRIKQHLNNILSSVYEKVKQHWG